MKKIIYLFLFTLSFGTMAMAQDDDDDRGGKLREKMVEYIQDKLQLSKSEAEKFQPIFFDYLKQLRNTRQEFKGDRLVLNQKISELRVRYREQFKPVLGDRRSNEVFNHERDFIEKARAELIDRRSQDRGAPGKRFRSPLLQ